jgi:ATP-dependent RNA helicase RhlE
MSFEEPGNGVAAAAPAADTPAMASGHGHRLHVVTMGRKRDALRLVLDRAPEQPALVLTRTKHGAEKIARYLDRNGTPCAAIHGHKSAGARRRAQEGFASGELKVLVATDLAARALAFESPPRLVNYDLPHTGEEYLARVANAAPGSEAISILTQDEAPQFREVRRVVPAEQLQLETLEGLEPATAFDPEYTPPPRVEADEAPEEATASVESPAASGEASTGEAEASEARAPASRPPSAAAEKRGRNRRQRNKTKTPGTAREPIEPGNRAPPVHVEEELDDDYCPGNSLALPPTHMGRAAITHGKQRRRGRHDPFAPVEIDEDRASIYDERQPDDYRDQWSVLGPDTARPSWTYADHGRGHGMEGDRGSEPRRGPQPAARPQGAQAPRGARRRRGGGGGKPRPAGNG